MEKRQKLLKVDGIPIGHIYVIEHRLSDSKPYYSLGEIEIPVPSDLPQANLKMLFEGMGDENSEA